MYLIRVIVRNDESFFEYSSGVFPRVGELILNDEYERVLRVEEVLYPARLLGNDVSSEKYDAVLLCRYDLATPSEWFDLFED